MHLVQGFCIPIVDFAFVFVFAFTVARVSIDLLYWVTFCRKRCAPSLGTVHEQYNAAILV